MRVLRTFVKPAHGAAMREAGSVTLRGGHGIVGDVIVACNSPRQVLFASEPVYRRLGLEPGALRENFLVDGEIESFASGQVLRLGPEVQVRLTIPCEPCAKLNRVRPGLARQVAGHRGFLGRVVAGGVVRPGDGVVLSEAVFPPMPLRPRERVYELVSRGRGVFDNITKFIVWIIPTNIGEALILLAAIVLGLQLPLVPIQLLGINLTDTLLGLSLAFEPKEQDVMNRRPRDPKQPLLTFPLIMRTGLVSLIMVGGGLSVFLWELRVEQAGLVEARTAGQLLLTYAPLMNRLLHTAPISGTAWLRIVGVAALIFVAVELEKFIRLHPRRGARPSAGQEILG